MPCITLTTDFGVCDTYVAQMKGVILATNPRVQIVDVTHAIPPQDVARAANALEQVMAAFPADTIHVAVVDPGVGSVRRLLGAEAAGQRWLAPDNGLLSPLLRRWPPARVHELTEDLFWRKPVSRTFHGRDILAPVAAHWSLNVDLARFGPAVEPASLVTLPASAPHDMGTALVGRVEYVDSFGNLITNIAESALLDASVRISVGGRTIEGMNRCYADQPPGSLLALIGSSGWLEVAVNGGSAARELQVTTGATIRVEPGARET